MDTTVSRRVIAASVTGSVGVTRPYRSAARCQGQRTRKAEGQAHGELDESAPEDQPGHLPRLAPTAMRTPISCVRCVTEYAITA